MILNITRKWGVGVCLMLWCVLGAAATAAPALLIYGAFVLFDAPDSIMRYGRWLGARIMDTVWPDHRILLRQGIWPSLRQDPDRGKPISPNQTLETNCRPASPLDAWREFGRAVHAPSCVSGGSRSALRSQNARI